MRIVFALCLMLISTGCHANDIMQGHWESSRPSAGRKANGHFGANMVLTASESQVRRDWVKYKANPRGRRKPLRQVVFQRDRILPEQNSADAGRGGGHQKGAENTKFRGK